jgi:tetratricopeptide (TPR) repeat protein
MSHLDNSPYAEVLKAAESLKKQGQYHEAIKLLEQILHDDLEATEAFEELGDNYMNLREYAKAISAIKMAISLNPESANAHYLLGFSYSALNDFSNSIKELEIANKLSANHPEILRCLGWSLFHGNKENQGLIILSRAHNLSPDDNYILTDMGMCYLVKREYNKAKQTFETILQNDPQNEKARECLNACRFFEKKTAKSK